MPVIEIRHAIVGRENGLVASCAALFAEDGVRDRLRNPQWPSEHGAGRPVSYSPHATSLGPGR